MPFIDLPDRIPGLRAQARGDRPWYRITNQAADEAEVMFYDEVGGWLGATADEFINDLRGITAPNILLRVNSPGGSVTEGIAIANALRSHPANVTVQVDGIAASIASVIAMAGDRVRMMPNSLLMVHEASGICAGDAAEMIKMAEVLDKISANIASAYATRAGGTVDEWRQVMRNETWYTAEEAVAAGLADEVSAARKTQPDEAEPEMRQPFDLAAYGYTGPRREQPTAETGLTEDIRSLIGEEIAAQLRAAVQPEPAAAPLPELVDKALPVHHTDTVDEPWDGPAAVKAMPNDDAVLRYCFAWQSDEAAREKHEEGDDDADDQKSSYKFPHHKTKGGPANLAACRDGLARLENSSIPEGDKAGVRAHLQAHLDDAKGADNSTGAEPAAEWRGEHGPELVPFAAAEPVDEWTALTAHLTEDEPDAWSVLVSHLTTTTASSSAATEAA